MRPSTGQVLERKRGRDIAYAIRFRAYGRRHYITLGRRSKGFTRKEAEAALRHVLADVERGTWQPPAPDVEPEAPRVEPTFHEFATDWLERRKLEGLRPTTIAYLHWALCDHLLPHFARLQLSQITIEEVDRYMAAAAAESERRRRAIASGRPLRDVDRRVLRPLAPSSINKTAVVLAAVMEVAVEYGHLVRNPAKGRRRRLPTSKPQRAMLEPDQVVALLAAAGELDAADRRRDRRCRRALLATLAYAGLRIGELLALRWRDVNLATGKIYVRQSKTDAGVREVDLQPELRDDLTAWKATTRYAAPGQLVFPTATGRPDNRNSVRRRVLVRAVDLANERLEQDAGDVEPLPALSPHALRRTFASWLIAEGEDVAYVMAQLGHTDPSMTLGIYAKVLRSKSRRPHAQRTQTGPEWAPTGTKAPDALLQETAAPAA